MRWMANWIKNGLLDCLTELPKSLVMPSYLIAIQQLRITDERICWKNLRALLLTSDISRR